MRTAPGSTFKPISATAGMEEGVITAESGINCSGIFTKVTPSPKCWRYPGSHGTINVVEAIKVSCNVFFYEVGYRLGSMRNGNYTDDEALERLKKYGAMYGLTENSGVEVDESDPLFSTTSGVTSAIGQGSNSFTGVQIARYVNTVASKGVNYELTLVDKVVDMNGSEEAKAEKSVVKLDVADSTISTIQSGMNQAANSYGIVKNIGLDAAAKTGTAQENANNPDHALIISYAPYSNPEVAMSIVLQNGYTSSNAIALAEDVYNFYFGKITLDQVKAGNSDGPAVVQAETGATE
jgi:penicillin-binding protein 2